MSRVATGYMSRTVKTRHVILLWGPMSSSLLEYLIALCLTSFLSWLIFQPFAVLKRIDEQIATEQQIIEGGLLLREHLQYGLMNYDTHRLDISPRVHPRGSIRFPSGKSLELSDSTEVDSEAVPVSYLILNFSRVLRVHQTTKNEEQVLVYACGIGDDSPAEQFYFLSLSVDGIGVVAGVRQEPVASRCSSYLLREVPSLVVPLRSSALLYMRALIPITFERTLYQDSSGQLRLVSTRGGEVVENQPLGHYPFRLEWEKKPLSVDGISMFHLRVFGGADSAPYTFSAEHTLSRVSSLHFLTYLFGERS